MAPTSLNSKKKRNRQVGEYPCKFIGCTKIFTRRDHLQRHERNHQPDTKIICDWPGCGMTFARSDIKEKHYKRKHIQGYDIELDKMVNSGAEDITDMKIDYKVSSVRHDSLSMGMTQLLSPQYPVANIPRQTEEDHQRVPEEINRRIHIRDMVQESIQEDMQSNIPNEPSSVESQVPLDQETGNNNMLKSLSPSDLIEWLFHDDGSIPQRSDIPNNLSPMSLLESMFAVSPDFPHSNNRKDIHDNIVHNLQSLIPSLNGNNDFTSVKIERCLEIYWLIFHPQYPILHKPSFSNQSAHPLLLLAMIMLGAGLAACTGVKEDFEDHKQLADSIADPLRWLIFSNKDCKPPAKVWVVQSLLLLEMYEITSTSRHLHERAYLHHGTKIQILRRSPILGGDPLKEDEEDEASNHMWKKWIEAESMKRATLMAFYLDTINATVYGHTIVLYAHQIKISLPCEDDLWEFDNTQQKIDTLQSQKPPKFLAALRKLLHRQKVQTSPFGRKILLAGLLTIMFQMQQKDLQLSFLEWDQVKDSWNEIISLAIDVWRTDICSGGCCNTETALRFSYEDREKLPPMLRPDDRRCKFCLYHISQIYMRITHYDYIIYAGAPSRMNVVAGVNEYTAVSKRVQAWASSFNGRVSVVHAYLFLCEMLLSPDNDDITYLYDPNTDPFLHRKNIIVSAVLVVFAYNYSTFGPEANVFDTISGYYPDKEDGYSYLKRIKWHLGKDFHISSVMNSAKFHENIKMFADILPTIPQTNNIVGLLKMFQKSFQNCNWEIGKEYSKLFKNCIERSLGRTKITCDDMYQIDTTN